MSSISILNKSAESCDNVSLLELVVVEEVDSFRVVSRFTQHLSWLPRETWFGQEVCIPGECTQYVR